MGVIWYSELYPATASDAGGTFVTRLWTPDGIVHDPLASGKVSRREDWLLHYLQVFVLKTTTGYLKQGICGELIIALDDGKSFLPLPGLHGQIVDRMGGLMYSGAPRPVTHGFGWCFYKAALSDGDKVYMRALYEKVRKTV